MKPKQPYLRTEQRNALTKRQTEILRLLVRGCTDKEMAGVLGISEETVAHHLRIMYDKHNVHCRAALAAALAELAPSDEAPGAT